MRTPQANLTEIGNSKKRCATFTHRPSILHFFRLRECCQKQFFSVHEHLPTVYGTVGRCKLSAVCSRHVGELLLDPAVGQGPFGDEMPRWEGL